MYYLYLDKNEEGDRRSCSSLGKSVPPGLSEGRTNCLGSWAVAAPRMRSAEAKRGLLPRQLHEQKSQYRPPSCPSPGLSSEADGLEWTCKGNENPLESSTPFPPHSVANVGPCPLLVADTTHADESKTG